ncbi:hypothetical protein XU18_0681 [Perkinsela sp. CCAP 1560/4]|nr:hypothetical protein XU18_0681 [Perkinsela sp. CCAP 1560/4]|eukprot:KNH09003.1 hypothetical protein XU18_0681 [Perkinsela sp. CCAP 1560/4]
MRWSSYTKLSICSVHNRNRLLEDLDVSGKELECKPSLPCILESPESSSACTFHRQVCKYVDLIQRGGSLYCNGFLRCDERYKKCSNHGVLRSLRRLENVNGRLICKPPFKCDKKFLCDFHKEYRPASCLVKYKKMYICRHDSRCSPHSYSARAVPVDTFLFLDELWGDGEDVLAHRVAETPSRNHRLTRNSTVSSSKIPSHQAAYHEGRKFEYLKDTMEWKKM